MTISTVLETPSESPNKTFASGEKKRAVFSYLKRELANPSVGLLFTKEHAEQVAHQINSSIVYVYQVLQSLERDKLITRKKQGRGKGILVTFPAKQRSASNNRVQKSISGLTTIGDAIGKIDEEIAELERAIEKKRLQRQSLLDLIGKEKGA